MNDSFLRIFLLQAFKDSYHQKICSPHFFSVCFFISSLTLTVRGKSAIHSKGRHASMIARELNPFFPLGMMGSKGPLQQRRMTSMPVSGSHLAESAQMTSWRFVISMSSSTTTVNLPK